MKKYFIIYILILLFIFTTLIILNKKQMETFQEKKNVKVIFKRLAGGGFFSTFNRLIEYLAHCPDNVVEIEYDVRASLKEWMPYIKEGEELFSKIFLPYPFPPNENIPKNETYILDFFYKNGEIKHPRELYNENRDQLLPYNKAFTKYIRLQPNVQSRLDNLINDMRQGYEQVVGIFVRSNALATEQPTGVMPRYDEYIEAINKIDRTKKTRFFLRIDNKEDLEFYKAVCVPFYVTDMERAETNKGDAPHTNGEKYLSLKDLEDVYLDIALLSNCDILIHCVSNMTGASLYMNMNQKSICVSKNKTT